MEPTHFTFSTHLRQCQLGLAGPGPPGRAIVAQGFQQQVLLALSIEGAQGICHTAGALHR